MENFKILSVRPIFSRLFLPTIRTVATTPKKSKNNSMIKVLISTNYVLLWMTQFPTVIRMCSTSVYSNYSNNLPKMSKSQLSRSYSLKITHLFLKGKLLKKRDLLKRQCLQFFARFLLDVSPSFSYAKILLRKYSNVLNIITVSLTPLSTH